MIAFPEMLVGPAKKAGMSTPPIEAVRDGKWDINVFPHWTVFCNIQLGSPLPSPTSHWVNAEIIAAIPEKAIKKLTFDQLVNRGVEVGFPIP